MAADFGDIILKYRRRAKLSQGDVAGRMGLSRELFASWEEGRAIPPMDQVPPLCETLGIPIGELFDFAQLKLTAQERQILSDLRQLNKSDRDVVENMVRTMVVTRADIRLQYLEENYLPFIQYPTAVAAGEGRGFSEEDIDLCFLRKNRWNQEADGILKVVGQSMEDVYFDGDFVYVRHTEQTPSPGRDVIISAPDGLRIKRVADDMRSVYSVNKAQPISYKDGEFQVVAEVLGVVDMADKLGPRDTGLLEEVQAEKLRQYKEAFARRYQAL